jgi:predicted transposase/invertase (TIGR01784 family)
MPQSRNRLAFAAVSTEPGRITTTAAAALPNAGGWRYGAGMPDQPDPGDSSPSSHRPPPGRRPPGGQPTPHDAVFRRILGMPANTASQLRAVLPPDLAARLDLGRLTPVPASFVDEALKWRYSDLLFTAPLDGRDAYVYLLAEHQSSTDPLMAFRMLRYVTRIWDQHLRDHPRARQLPAVIPLVVHHGRTRWASPVQLLDLIDLHPAARQAAQACLPRFEFLLDDLASIDGAQLRDRKLTPSALITLLLLKTATGNPRIPAELRQWAGQLRAVLDQPGGGEAFIAILTYIELVSEAPASELRDRAASPGPDAEEAYMTTAEMLRTEGRAEALVQVLTIKFGPLPARVSQTVHGASSDQVQAWTARAVTAGTLDQVFA